MRSFRKIAIFCLIGWSVCLTAHAENPIQDAGYVATGATQIVGGALALPVEILKGGVQSFPFGIIAGALRGTVKTLGGVFGGAVNIARGSAPYAKYAAFV